MIASSKSTLFAIFFIFAILMVQLNEASPIKTSLESFDDLALLEDEHNWEGDLLVEPEAKFHETRLFSQLVKPLLKQRKQLLKLRNDRRHLIRTLLKYQWSKTGCTETFMTIVNISFVVQLLLHSVRFQNKVIVFPKKKYIYIYIYIYKCQGSNSSFSTYTTKISQSVGHTSNKVKVIWMLK